MKSLILSFVILLSNLCISQNAKNDNIKQETKMEAFASKTGVITKFTDIKLGMLKSSYANAETRIRKLSSGSVINYFYQIEKPSKYGNSTASIEYSDLLEVIKALKILKMEAKTDVNSNPDYLENKFITDDGFQLGYYVSKGKVVWYIKLEKYGSDKTLYMKYLDKIESNFIEAKNKIEELKNNL